MQKAWNLTRQAVHYRHQAFSAGLRASGYDVQDGEPQAIKPGDVVLGWNRYWELDGIASRVEAAGGVYICAENGYLRGRHDGGDHYALALHAHNGRGVVPEGDHSRWDALGVPLAPWRATGGHVLVCPNRPFGQPSSAMSPEWPEDVCRQLATLTKREIRLRPHPGNAAPAKPLAEDLKGAWCCVVWSSSAGVHALVAGIPVICEARYWICRSAAETDIEDFELLDTPGLWHDRESAMHRLAWSQYSLAEIESGYAFDLLRREAQRKEQATA